jgi:hypothetical protein
MLFGSCRRHWTLGSTGQCLAVYIRKLGVLFFVAKATLPEKPFRRTHHSTTLRGDHESSFSFYLGRPHLHRHYRKDCAG